MNITFSWAWFFGGLAIILLAVVFLRLHEWIANTFGAGVADYERYRLYAVIAVGVGFLAMLNLVPIILGLIIGGLFSNGNPAS